MWGHAVIFAGDRRLKGVREKGGGSHGAGSVWLRVVQKHFALAVPICLGARLPTSRVPAVWLLQA